VVKTALREYAARHRRIAALDHYVAAAQHWDYEGWQQLHAGGKVPAERRVRDLPEPQRGEPEDGM
jgi:hypothetical protein